MGRALSPLLDSCILIDALAGNGAAAAYVRGIRRGAISHVTWMEVLVGAVGAEEERTVRSFLGAFEVISLDEAVAEEAVLLRRTRRLKLPDAIIFATARVHGRDLATRNTRDFTAGEPGIIVPYRLL